MKLFVFLGVLAVIGLVVTGAITLQKSSDNKITIEIDREKVREDARRVVEEGRHVLDEAGSAFRQNSAEANRN
jgi:hypothetical protein